MSLDELFEPDVRVPDAGATGAGAAGTDGASGTDGGGATGVIGTSIGAARCNGAPTAPRGATLRFDMSESTSRGCVTEPLESPLVETTPVVLDGTRVGWSTSRTTVTSFVDDVVVSTPFEVTAEIAGSTDAASAVRDPPAVALAGSLA